MLLVVDLMKYKTKADLREFPESRDLVSKQDLESMAELNPPTDIMPKGNVGTPTKTFLELIKQCKLPPKVIAKLGLTFPKSRSKHRYGTVPFDYTERISRRKKKHSSGLVNASTSKCHVSNIVTEENSSETVVRSASGHLLVSNDEYLTSQNAENNGKASNDETISDDASEASDGSRQVWLNIVSLLSNNYY